MATSRKRPLRDVLGIDNLGIPQFLITRDQSQAEELWATIGVGQYWIDGCMIHEKGKLTDVQIDACEAKIVNSITRSEVKRVATKKGFKRGGGLR